MMSIVLFGLLVGGLAWRPNSFLFGGRTKALMVKCGLAVWFVAGGAAVIWEIVTRSRQLSDALKALPAATGIEAMFLAGQAQRASNDLKDLLIGLAVIVGMVGGVKLIELLTASSGPVPAEPPPANVGASSLELNGQAS